MVDISKIDVIAPNFKRRHSGVTSTVIRLIPIQAKSFAITACGPDLPDDVPNVPWQKLLTMSRRGPSGARVWHARRNVEMIAGLALKHLLRKQLKLVFTSAAQRHHSKLTRWLILQQDAIIATSARSASFLEREATVIMHGIDCDVFQPSEDRTALRARLDLPKDGPLIGCFGRIRHQKGNDLFVEAMCKALPKFPKAHALIMGRATADNQDYLKSLETRVAQAGLQERILFRDEVPIEDLAAHFQALDLYIAPQRWEGFGLTPVEAMACGAPVVGTRVGAFEEMIVDGENGYLVDIEDVDAMSGHITDMLQTENALAEMGHAAHDRTTTYFNISRESETIISIYRKLLK